MPKDENAKEAAVRRSQMVRAFEASCKIEHPTDMERRFRESLMCALGSEFDLKRSRKESPL